MEVHDHFVEKEFSQPSVLSEDNWPDASGTDTPPLVLILIPTTPLYASRGFLSLTLERQPVTTLLIKLRVTQVENQVGGAPAPSL